MAKSKTFLTIVSLKNLSTITINIVFSFILLCFSLIMVIGAISIMLLILGMVTIGFIISFQKETKNASEKEHKNSISS